MGEILQAGMGSVVLGRMYNALYGYLTSLKKYPVGMYDPKLSVQKNIERFQDFVNKMNGQTDYFSKAEAKMNRLEEQIANVNEQREEKGFTAVTMTSNIISVINESR